VNWRIKHLSTDEVGAVKSNGVFACGSGGFGCISVQPMYLAVEQTSYECSTSMHVKSPLRYAPLSEVEMSEVLVIDVQI
jgi:hypothetical protein